MTKGAPAAPKKYAMAVIKPKALGYTSILKISAGHEFQVPQPPSILTSVVTKIGAQAGVRIQAQARTD